jgi:hypothetical protein
MKSMVLLTIGVFLPTLSIARGRLGVALLHPQHRRLILPPKSFIRLSTLYPRRPVCEDTPTAHPVGPPVKRQSYSECRLRLIRSGLTFMLMSHQEN